MSTALAVYHGRFGRVTLYRLDRDVIGLRVERTAVPFADPRFTNGVLRGLTGQKGDPR